MNSRPHTSRNTAAALAALALIAFTGCGRTNSPAAPSSNAAAKPAPAVTVQLGEYFYRPKALTVSAGQPVRFVNVGKIEHTVADTTAAGDIRSALIRPRPLAHGRSQTVRFASAGTVHYLCTFHPTLMRGVITVTP
jgi:plastocyanin